jgi:hypothetical protein
MEGRSPLIKGATFQQLQIGLNQTLHVREERLSARLGEGAAVPALPYGVALMLRAFARNRQNQKGRGTLAHSHRAPGSRRPQRIHSGFAQPWIASSNNHRDPRAIFARLSPFSLAKPICARVRRQSPRGDTEQEAIFPD